MTEGVSNDGVALNEVKKPPYLAAVAVFLAVLTGYVWTLAPTVTFWDAGEFIAASKILGIPHPPGTPLFVLMSHVWADFVGFGEFAYRTNLMTATFSAGAAAMLFLLVAQTLRKGATVENGDGDELFAIGGAAAAAVVSAFVFTVWQNSNETEVYMVASFSIAASSWFAWLWRSYRGTHRAAHMLLVIVYLQAISLGNHLITLLVGPAIIGFLFHVIKTSPLPDEENRKIEWAQWWIICGAWVLLVATGLGSTTLMQLGGVVFLVAAGFAIKNGGHRFVAMVVALGVVGASAYLFLYIRAGLGPFINEADPSTWESLLAVIRREQYPPRAPWDNPLFPSGQGNPGRTIGLMWLQIQNYLQYFDWQWSNGLAATTPVFARIRMPFTLLFTSLGIYGLLLIKSKDESVFWLLLLLFLVTGPALVGYMNFKPGYALGYDQYPQAVMHEVRERDYFFTISFQMWGLFAGIGIAGLFATLRAMIFERNRADRNSLKPAPVMLLALLPLVLNFSAASRRHGPEATLAKDFAYDLLQSIEPYGIVFTNGDNDTFPLWYAQEVAGIRQDVAVVNLSLGNTDWYIKQLRDNPVRDFIPEEAPMFSDFEVGEKPGSLHTWSDTDVENLFPQALPVDVPFSAGLINKTFSAGTELFVKDILVLKLIQENAGKRSIYFSITAGSGNWMGLDEYMSQEALAIKVNVTEGLDSGDLVPGLLGVPVNVPRTDSLAWHVYRYSGLFEADTLELDPTNRNIATNLSLPFLLLGEAYMRLGNMEGVERNFRRAHHLSPNPNLLPLIEAASIVESTEILGDTALSDTGSDTSQ